MGVVNWGLNGGGGGVSGKLGGGGGGGWGGGVMAVNWGEGKKNWVKKTYNYYPWNSGGGSYENLIETPENLVSLGFWLKKQWNEVLVKLRWIKKSRDKKI